MYNYVHTYTLLVLLEYFTCTCMHVAFIDTLLHVGLIILVLLL